MGLEGPVVVVAGVVQEVVAVVAGVVVAGVVEAEPAASHARALVLLSPPVQRSAGRSVAAHRHVAGAGADSYTGASHCKRAPLTS